MEIQIRHDIFEPTDRTALVCVDEPEVQRAVVDQLTTLEYRIHTGLFAEDISLKLRAHSYDVVVIYETFNGSIAEGNPVLLETIRTPALQRRDQFVALIGPNMVTNDRDAGVSVFGGSRGLCVRSRQLSPGDPPQRYPPRGVLQKVQGVSPHGGGIIPTCSFSGDARPPRSSLRSAGVLNHCGKNVRGE